MRLLTFERRPAPASEGHHGPPRPAGARLGVELPDGRVVDLNRAFAEMLARSDAGAPEAEADSLLPGDMLAFLRGGGRARARAEQVLDWTLDALAGYDGPDLERCGAVEAARALRVRAPVTRPGKILGVARNYAAHARERGAEPPEEPVLFVKASSCVIGPGDEIVLPAASTQVDYEGELAVVIGRPCRDVEREAALAHVAGYTVANDVTARDYQGVRGQRYLGKSCDTFAPLGPVLVTADEIGDPQQLAISTTVSGETRQKADTSQMLFPVEELIAFASRLMTLEPGDVILTGTPAGVGAALDPPRFLRAGDLVEVEIEGVGRLHNLVRQQGEGRG